MPLRVELAKSIGKFSFHLARLNDSQPRAQSLFQTVLAKIDLDIITIAEDGPVAGREINAGELLELKIAEISQTPAAIAANLFCEGLWPNVFDLHVVFQNSPGAIVGGAILDSCVTDRLFELACGILGCACAGLSRQ